VENNRDVQLKTFVTVGNFYASRMGNNVFLTDTFMYERPTAFPPEKTEKKLRPGKKTMASGICCTFIYAANAMN